MKDRDFSFNDSNVKSSNCSRQSAGTLCIIIRRNALNCVFCLLRYLGRLRHELGISMHRSPLPVTPLRSV